MNVDYLPIFKECIEEYGEEKGLTKKGKGVVLRLLDRGADANEFGYTFICILVEAASCRGLREEVIKFAFQNDTFRFIHGPVMEPRGKKWKV
jgi:hypothetical protein